MSHEPHEYAHDQDWVGGAAGADEVQRWNWEIERDKEHRRQREAYELMRTTLERAGIPFLRAHELARRAFLGDDGVKP